MTPARILYTTRSASQFCQLYIPKGYEVSRINIYSRLIQYALLGNRVFTYAAYMKECLSLDSLQSRCKQCIKVQSIYNIVNNTESRWNLTLSNDLGHKHCAYIAQETKNIFMLQTFSKLVKEYQERSNTKSWVFKSSAHSSSSV
jgi:hypothetical protein